MAEVEKTRRKRRPKTGKGLAIAGAAVGIGSAALVAALLYAGRTKTPTKPATKHVPEATD